MSLTSPDITVSLTSLAVSLCHSHRRQCHSVTDIAGSVTVSVTYGTDTTDNVTTLLRRVSQTPILPLASTSLTHAVSPTSLSRSLTVSLTPDDVTDDHVKVIVTDSLPPIDDPTDPANTPLMTISLIPLTPP